MRLANERDQALIRSAVSDAGASLLTFIPSLGSREVFTFGSGLALPTRMRFAELPPEVRPNSDASGDTRADGGNNMSRELISSVIERWRLSHMSSRMVDEDVLDYGSPLDSPALQPAQPAAPPMPAKPPPSPRGEALRASLLKKPLDPNARNAPPTSPPGYPPRFR
jgi:hypothetical protein